MKRILFLLTFVIILSNSFAQPYKTIKAQKPYKWMAGISWSAIDDDGRPFTGLFDVPNWNYEFYPTRLSLDRYFKKGWSAEAVATYTKYLPGKLINGSTSTSGIFFAFDVNGKYSFYQYYAPNMRWFEPYFTFGAGYTFRSAPIVSAHVPNINLGFGMNFWISQSIGVQFHSNAKFGMFPKIWNTNTNYLQHSAGIVYRWGENKKHKNGDFDKKRYPWSHKKPKYKPNKGH